MRLAKLCLATMLVCASACPLRAATVFRVSDYGATVDDDGDDTAAIQAAIDDAARAAGPAEVVLNAGVYRVSRLHDAEAALRLYGLRHFTLRGEAGRTELRVTTFMLPALVLRDARDVTITGLTIDYEPLPFTQGLVTAVSTDEGWFEFEPMEGYPDPTWQPLQPGRGFGMLIDVSARQPRDAQASAMFLDRWETADGRVWRAYPRADCLAQLAAFAVGDGYVHLARDGFAALPILGSADCLLEDVTIHAAPAPAFMLMRNEGVITLRRCMVRFREGTDRWITTDGDGVHAPDNRVGPVIENCYFEGMADDGINIYASPTRIIEAPATDRLVLHADAGAVRIGDRLQVFSPTEGVVRGIPRVASAVRTGENLLMVGLDQPVDAIGMSLGEGDLKNAACVFNLDQAGRGYIIRGNTFASHRGRCMVLRTTEDGRVEGNTLTNPNAIFAIMVANEPGWPEGPVPIGGLTLRDNVIDYAAHAGISIHGFGLHGPSATPIGSYVIESNTISRVNGAAIHLGRVGRTTVRGNQVSDCVMPLASDRWEMLDGAAPR